MLSYKIFEIVLWVAVSDCATKTLDFSPFLPRILFFFFGKISATRLATSAVAPTQLPSPPHPPLSSGSTLRLRLIRRKACFPNFHCLHLLFVLSLLFLLLFLFRLLLSFWFCVFLAIAHFSIGLGGRRRWRRRSARRRGFPSSGRFASILCLACSPFAPSLSL